jgi:hypothetical protein
MILDLLRPQFVRVSKLSPYIGVSLKVLPMIISYNMLSNVGDVVGVLNKPLNNCLIQTVK